MQTENSRESREAVLDLVIAQAQFLAPADIVPETEGKEAALRFQLLTNQEGQHFFQMCIRDSPWGKVARA